MLRYATNFEFLDKDWFGDQIIYDDLGGTIRNQTGEELLAHIDNKIADILPERIVIDPISVAQSLLSDDYRLFLFDLTTRLKNWQATTVLTGELDIGNNLPTEEAYSSDGLIVLSMDFNGDTTRKYLEIIKMRGTDHKTGKYSVTITREKGLIILRTKF